MSFLFANKMNVRASKQPQLISIQTILCFGGIICWYYLLRNTLDIQFNGKDIAKCKWHYNVHFHQVWL